MRNQFFGALFVSYVTLIATASAQQPDPLPGNLPVTEAASIQYYQSLNAPLTYAQQRARFESEQRLYRIEWNNWTGYSPSRPTLNANYMSGIAPRYYIPSRGILIHTGMGRSWYW